jgi:hypothetical protein
MESAIAGSTRRGLGVKIDSAASASVIEWASVKAETTPTSERRLPPTKMRPSRKTR